VQVQGYQVHRLGVEEMPDLGRVDGRLHRKSLALQHRDNEPPHLVVVTDQ